MRWIAYILTPHSNSVRKLLPFHGWKNWNKEWLSSLPNITPHPGEGQCWIFCSYSWFQSLWSYYTTLPFSLIGISLLSRNISHSLLKGGLLSKEICISLEGAGVLRPRSKDKSKTDMLFANLPKEELEYQTYLLLMSIAGEGSNLGLNPSAEFHFVY